MSSAGSFEVSIRSATVRHRLPRLTAALLSHSHGPALGLGPARCSPRTNFPQLSPCNDLAVFSVTRQPNQLLGSLFTPSRLFPPRYPLSFTTTLYLSHADKNTESHYFAAFLKLLALRAPNIPAPRHPSMIMLNGSGVGRRGTWPMRSSLPHSIVK